MTHPHDILVLVTLAILIFYFATGLNVAATRSRHGVHPPVMTGHELVERAIRVQANTLEWLALILAPMWLFHLYFGQLIPSILGVVWIVGRALYWAGYVREPKRREIGFGIQALPVAILIIGAAVGAVRALILIGA
ncbi:MAG: hypothetical protein JWM33_3926 [Caulobacteraceae bacterium]|nr:hypothetical protein [Caulobacteraceae bacterium]